MTKSYKSIRVFKSDAMEWFTHVHPSTPLLFWTPIILFFFWRSVELHRFQLGQILGVGLFALGTWTLAEYLLHRFVFHYEPSTKLGKYVIFLAHGIHHDDPQDPTRLVMPPVVASLLAALLYGVFRLLLGQAWVDPFFASFLIGYLIYDYTHYAIHHFVPRTAWGKRLKQHHMVHHFAAHEAKYGVSSSLWDHVFGTYEESARPQNSRRKSSVG